MTEQEPLTYEQIKALQEVLDKEVPTEDRHVWPSNQYWRKKLQAVAKEEY